MSIESPADWRGLREVGHITRLTLDALDAHVRPNNYDPSQTDVRDGWTIRTRDGSLAAHVEHTLVITKQDPIILTAA